MSDFFYNISLGTMNLLKRGAVYAFLVFLMLLSLIDLPWITTGEIRQGLLVSGLYFWSIYRPTLLPYSVVFAFGITLDLITGGLLGLNTICFITLVMIVRHQSRFLLGQSWQMIWAGFMVAIISIQAFQTLVYGTMFSAFPPFWQFAANISIAGLFYPLLHPLFMAQNRALDE